MLVLLHTRSAVYPQRLFWCELQSFADIRGRDVCLLSTIMQRGDSTQRLFPEIPTWSLKIIHRGSSEQFLMWELFLLLWYSVHELTDDRFTVVTAQDDNF